MSSERAHPNNNTENVLAADTKSIVVHGRSEVFPSRSPPATRAQSSQPLMSVQHDLESSLYVVPNNYSRRSVTSPNRSIERGIQHQSLQQYVRQLPLQSQIMLSRRPVGINPSLNSLLSAPYGHHDPMSCSVLSDSFGMTNATMTLERLQQLMLHQPLNTPLGFNMTSTETNAHTLLQMQRLHYERLLQQQEELLAAITAESVRRHVHQRSHRNMRAPSYIEEFPVSSFTYAQRSCLLPSSPPSSNILKPHDICHGDESHQNLLSSVESKKGSNNPYLKKNKRKKDKLKPKRPLSAYNLFFKAERARILHKSEVPKMHSDKSIRKVIDNQNDVTLNQNDAVVVFDDDDDTSHFSQQKDLDYKKSNQESNSSMTILPTQHSIDEYSPERLPQTLKPQTEKHEVDASSSASFTQEVTKSKKVPHGKIGFEELAKAIGSKWNTMTSSDRKIYDDLSKQDLERYREEMEVYLGGKQKDA